jgi:uncharacterized protein (TIGR03118 family)
MRRLCLLKGSVALSISLILAGSTLVSLLCLSIITNSAAAQTAEQKPEITPNVVAVAGYRKTNLVSDLPGLAPLQDPLLVNPWGVTLTGSSPFWVSNNVSSTSTLYRGDVGGSPLTANPGLSGITIPGGLPTGTVANSTASDFVVTSGSASGKAAFLFSSLTGNILGWNPNVPAAGSTTATIAKSLPGHVYTGLALGSSGGNNFLYAADFANGKIDVFNGTFDVQSAASFPFVDTGAPALPANYHPFNIQNLGGVLYVAYAQVDPTTGDNANGPGLGFVSKFSTSGAFIARLVSNGPLDAPWGMTVSPASFGAFGGAVLVGNFAEKGTINAFNPTTGAFLGALKDEGGSNIEIDKLWALNFGNGGSGGDTTALYFSAGIGDEQHGLFGSIRSVAAPTSLFQFSSPDYTVNENGEQVNITVIRSGDTSTSATVNYAPVPYALAGRATPAPVFREGTPLPQETSPAVDHSYERKPGGAAGSTQDTGDNFNDFQLLTPSNPQNLSSPPTPAPGASSTPGTIVISEFRLIGPGSPESRDQFVELYNNGDVPIAIGGWKLKGFNGASGVFTFLTVNTGTTIPARGHFLATCTGYSGSVPGNQTYTTFVAANGGIAVTRPNDAIVDQVSITGGDYVLSPGTLAFGPGETSKTFQVATVPDAAVEGDEVVDLLLSNPTGAGLTSPTSAVLTIKDNTGVGTPLPTLSINDASALEGNAGTTNLVFTVTLSSASAFNTTVDFATSNGTATAPSDYAAAGGNVSFAPGETTKTITVQVNGDTAFEPDETFLVTLTSPANAGISRAQATGTILNDDSGGTLQFSSNTFSVNENGGSATITVTRTGSTVGTVTVSFATSNGTATAGQDYTNTVGTLTFGPGVASQTFNVPIIDDAISEGTESVILTLSGPTGGAGIGSPGIATLFVIDNEPPPPSALDAFAVTVGNNLLRFNSSQPGTIASTKAITGLQSGEVVLGIDVRPATGQLFALGSTSRLYILDTATGAATAVGGPFTPALNGVDFGVDFNPTVDRLRVVSDADQNLRLNPNNGTVAGTDTALAFASGDPNFGANPNVTGSAYTNNFAGATTTSLYGIDSNLDTLVLQGSPNASPVSPNSGQLFTVGSLGVNTNGLVGFDIQSSNNKAFASLTNPGDVSSGLYTVNLSTGASTLIGPIGGAELIRDIALVPVGSFQFSASTASVVESAGHLTVTVTRTGNTTIPASVSFSTADGTASQKSDYIIASGTLDFASGDTSKTFDVLLIDDAYVESNETFTINLSTATNDFSLGIPNSLTVTITDNDTVAPTGNPIDDAQFFVRQQYLDFLNREPDPGGLAFWTNEITKCGSDQACIFRRRAEVSAAFFIETEFQETGYFAVRLYRASFGGAPGTRPTYLEFTRDRNRLIVGANLEANKVALVNDFVTRSEFTNLYPASQTPAQYVDALNTNTGNSLTQSERDALVAGLLNNTETRATVLRKVVDNAVFRQREFNAAFVLMQYFGYLRRDPEPGGFAFWLNILNQSNNFKSMVCAFISSQEYQDRFSPVRTRNDSACGSIGP